MKILSSDPWAELIRDVNRSGCKNLEAGDLQPQNLTLYLKKLRDIWAAAVLFEMPVPTRLFNSPLRKAHPLIEILHFDLAKRNAKRFPPLSHITPVLSIGELCQLALLKAISGGDGKSLAQKILPFHQFSSLWCKEKAYNENEAVWSIALLLRAFGKYIPIPPNPDPYFIALAKFSPEWTEEQRIEDGGARLYLGPQMTAAFATSGEGIPLGVLHAGEIEIPAFGPHAYPLNDPNRFGIRRAYPEERWAATAAEPDVWFEAKPNLVQGIIETRFFGLKSESPIAFAYYVKAEEAHIEGDILKPKHLRRYLGPSKKVTFIKGASRLSLDCEPAVKMEVIPLAGEGCFWNANFLIAYEIPLIDGRFNSLLYSGS